MILDGWMGGWEHGWMDGWVVEPGQVLLTAIKNLFLQLRRSSLFRYKMNPFYKTDWVLMRNLKEGVSETIMR